MNGKAPLIAITGGIGSGKSVVSEILRSIGYPVYDCDLMAKRIMDSDCNIHAMLCEQIHPLAVVDGVINRPLISKIVFEDSKALVRLNGIVHSSVIAALQLWAEEKRAAGATGVFVETAILIQSGLVKCVDDIWEVVAPMDIRIERVVKRSNLSEAQVIARIKSQNSESLDTIAHKVIFNSPSDALLPQVHRLLG